MPTTDFLPAIGGVAQHIFELAKAHAAAGHDVEVIAAIWSKDWSNIQKPPYFADTANFRTYYIPLTLNTNVRFLSGRISGMLSDRKFCSALLKRLADASPDIVHWHAIDSRKNPMSLWTSSPKVWTNHTSQFIEAVHTSKGRAACAAEAKAADFIMAPSEELRDLTISLGYPVEKTVFISNGVDSKRFRPDVDGSSWRNKIALAKEDRLVLCPRRLEKKNGVKYFIEAAIQLLQERLKNVVFAVAGNFTGPKSDSDEAIVNRLISESGFHSHFRLLGRVENAEIPGLYAASSIVVMPSLIEATSLSAMEAMSTSKALVSTNVGGLPFLIRDGENGILVPPASPLSLAAGMLKLLEDPSLARKLGEAGRKRVEEELDWSAIAKRTREVYALAGAR